MDAPHFDLRDQFASLQCSGFNPFTQGSCNACAAASVASIVSILACISHGRNITFSAQRIWDCYDGSCAQGVMMNDFLDSILLGPKASWILQPLVPAHGRSINMSNYSECSGLGEERDRLFSIVNHKFGIPSQSSTNNNGNLRALQRYLRHHGPVMGVLPMSPGDLDAFSHWKNGTFPFQPSQNSGPPIIFHALTIIGWENRSGEMAWLVLNSMGPAWGADGIGLVKAPFEDNWYSFTLGGGGQRGDLLLLSDIPIATPQMLHSTKDNQRQRDLIVLVVTAFSMLAIGGGFCAWAHF